MYSMTIDGKAASSAELFDVVDPASGSVFAQAPNATHDQVDQAMAAALGSAREWQRDRSVRGHALHAIAQTIRTHVSEIAEAITLEMGKPIAEATGETLGAAAYFDYYADLELPVESIRDDADVRVELRRRPIGPVVAITPWNGPVVLLAAKVAPALAAGNPVVLKPSPYAPISALVIGELIRDLLPPGVLAVLTGTGDLGRWVTEHPVPRKITFTGSIQTGKGVALTAANDLKRLTLELGGNDPAIALDDVDAAAFARDITRAGFANAGQICVAPKRIYVHESRYDEIVEALAAEIRQLKVGSGRDPQTDMGPVANRAQLDFVTALVDDAVSGGGRLVTGGRIDGDGLFYSPTLLVDVGAGTRIVEEEQFGPVMPVVRYRDESEAVRSANDTMFGLGSSVWSADTERAEAVADQLEAGHTWINTHFASLGPEQPLVGVKWSGMGIEGGPWGLESFTDPHLRYVKKNFAPDPVELFAAAQAGASN